MSTGTRENSLGFGNLILRFRKPIGLTLIAITIFMAYWAVHVPIATRFEDLFPAQHPNTLLYREFRNQYGGAQTLVVLLRVQQGDIFNPKTLLDIQQITREVDALSGVNHNEIFSLASYRVVYARAEPGALLSAPYMYPDVPKTQDQITDLKNIVLAHREQLAGYYTRDGKGALVIASFNERRLDYKRLFDGVQDIIRKHEDANTRIYASGAAMFSAWGYHYLPRIQLIFALSIALMLIILYVSLGRRTGWWAPIVTGTCSAIWGLGFVSLMDFNFDPVMLVIPLILTARDLSHGIQWHGRYYDELDRTDDKMRACAATADVMFAPGLLAVLANIAGIIFIAVSDIPVLRQIGFGGAVWLGASLAMVFVFQPILMSYLSRPQIRERGWLTRSSHADQSTRHTFLDWLVRVPVTPGILRTVLIVVGAFFIIVGVAASRRVPIGYQTAGTPIYRTNAKVNRDTAEISQFIPTNYAWVVLDTPTYPSLQSTVGLGTLRMNDDLAAYLISRRDAVAVVSFETLGTKPMNMLLHNGFPKYLGMPDNNQLSANLWSFFFGSTAPGEANSFFAYSPAATNTCIRLLLPDHTYTRLTRLRDDLSRLRRHVSFAGRGRVVCTLLRDGQLRRIRLHERARYRTHRRHDSDYLIRCRTGYRLCDLHRRSHPRRSHGRVSAQRRDHNGAAYYRRLGLRDVCSDGRRGAAVGILAAAVPQRNERAAHSPDEREHDCRPADSACRHRMDPPALHHSLRANGPRPANGRRRGQASNVMN